MDSRFWSTFPLPTFPKWEPIFDPQPFGFWLHRQVAFDIDANGIVNVSASDKGTGKKQALGWRALLRSSPVSFFPFFSSPFFVKSCPPLDSIAFDGVQPLWWVSKGKPNTPPRFAGPIFGVVRFHRARQAITIRSSGGLSDAEAGRPPRLAARVPLGVGRCIVCTRGIRIVCTRGTGSSLHAGLFCPGSFVHAVLTAMHKKGQGR